MFSLIITIISIALVAALALATLYYGASSWTRGNAAASAATLTNQGQQIRGAMELYYSQKSAYPNTLQELVDLEYLKTVPVPPQTVASLDATLVAPVLAADEVWALLAAGQPAFMVHESISKDVCQELNYLNRGSDAIYSKIDGKSTAQCFGEAEGPFTFVVGVPGTADGSASLEKAVEDYNVANDPDLPIADVGGLTPDDVTVPETRNKHAQAPGGDDGDGEDPPVDANLVYENFSGTGLLDGRALTHGPAGVVWSARENGTLGGGYYSLPDWEYDKFFITWNSALLPQLGVFEFKTKGGNVPPADGCDADGYSWEQQYAKHWFAGPGNFWIDIKAEGGRDCGEASPLGWTDVTLAITRDDGTSVELNHYDGDNFTLPVADEMTFRLELHPSAARLYINGQLWLQADNTTLAGTVAHPKGGGLYIYGGAPTMFPLDNTALDALELMLVADRAGEATAADYFYVHTDPNYRLPDQLK